MLFFDHPFNKIVENNILGLWTVDPETKFAQISIDIELRNPRIGRPDPAFYLVYHDVKDWKVLPFIAGNLGDIKILDRSVSFPFVRDDIGGTVNVPVKYAP